MNTIANEIFALRALKHRLPEMSWFPGDSNWEAIDAQIAALQGQPIRQYYHSWHLYNAAERALQWRDGEKGIAPSEIWKRRLT